MIDPARPFVKWVGGKRQLVPELLVRVGNSADTYFEPFVGGGALFWALRSTRRFARKYVLSDSSHRLIRTYLAIRDHVEDVIESLSRLKYDRRSFEEFRNWDIDAEADDVDVAVWAIYLNKTCFNGLYRVNRAGKFNVPFGRYSNPTICDSGNLRRCSELLQGADIRCADFWAVAQRARRGDFVYFDPPYVPLSATSSFTGYSSDGFSNIDQERLRDLAQGLKKRGVRILLSNSIAARDLYGGERGFLTSVVSANRAINSKGAGRGAVKEILVQ